VQISKYACIRVFYLYFIYLLYLKKEQRNCTQVPAKIFEFCEDADFWSAIFKCDWTDETADLVRAGRVAFFTICLVNLFQIVSKIFRVGSRTGLRT